MTKQVLLTIAGLQIIDAEKADPIEIVTAGDYYFRNGKHYVLYEEAVEGSNQCIQNTVKIGDGTVEVMKRGLTHSHMIFEKNKTNLSCYETPFGSMRMETRTSSVDIQETEHDIDVHVNYTLGINEDFVADCEIKMNIKSKDAGTFTLQQ